MLRSNLQPTLDLLDEGLRLYRREFSRFALISVLGMVPTICIFILLAPHTSFVSPTANAFRFYGVFIVSLPLAVYLIGAISRATVASLEGRPVLLREALAIGPLRLLGMGCFSIAFLTVFTILIGMLSIFCFCPLYFGIGIGVAGVFSSFDGSGTMGVAIRSLLVMLMGTLFILLYGMSLVLNGATYSSLIFSLQPFIQGKLRIAEALRRSLNMIFHRFGANLLVYLCASLIFGVLALSSTLAVTILIPMPLAFLIGSDSFIIQVLSVVVIVAGFALTFPPLPIWMVLLYRRRMAERDGGDLAERIAVFAGSVGLGYAEQINGLSPSEKL